MNESAVLLARGKQSPWVSAKLLAQATSVPGRNKFARMHIEDCSSEDKQTCLFYGVKS